MARPWRTALLPRFNYLSLIPFLRGMQKEDLEDFLERVIRIFEVYDKPGDEEELVEELAELLEEIRAGRG